MPAGYQTVLVPTDGSDEVNRALNHAFRIATDHSAEVHALYIVDTRVLKAASENRESVAADLRDQGDAAVKHVAGRAAGVDVECTTVVREGTPDVAIRDYADEIAADVVVMAPRGLTGRDRLRSLGSVTERVVGSADHPVLVVGGESG
jgi:nucleotide-binding universal stress UspA family protein